MNGAFPETEISGCPVPLWKFYFPNQEWNPSSHISLKVESWSRRLAENGFQDEVDSISINGHQSNKGIEIKYQSALDMLGEEFACDFDESPETTISVLGAALRLLAGKDAYVSKITARIVDYPKISKFQDLRASNVGRFVSFRGTVVRVGTIKALMYQAAFLCQKCQQTITVQMVDGIYRPPSRCTTNNCTGKQFALDCHSSETICRNSQKIKIQELENKNDAGSIPKALDCELLDDLIDTISPGEHVTVSGVFRMSESDENISKNSNGGTYSIIVNSIRGSKSSQTENTNVEEESASLFTTYEREMIHRIAGSKNVFKLLVDSLCPEIIGHGIIKAGLLLGLFRGTENPPARSNPHILIVGDPGLGKSQILTAVANVAPRSVLVGANTTTAAGLTAGLHQEGGPGEYALEAGALVLADQGCCCIDEFDKLTEHQVLLDVMEQQVVNVAKAGVVCSLSARTSILAAANPVGGRYNHDKTISQNIKLNDALLSRFDLIFVILDRPDEEIDKYLTERILAKTTANNSNSNSQFSKAKTLSTQLAETGDSMHSTAFLRDLSKKHQVNADNLISHQMMKKYISYAQRFISPKMSEEATQVLKDFYLSCRKNSSDDALSITTRQLESAIRLSQARAKAELRLTVTKEDAEEVVSIMSFCMFECFKINENDSMHIQNSRSFGKPKSKSVMIKEFSAELARISSRTRETTFTFDQLRQLYNALFPSASASASISFSDLLESLNHHGQILKKPGNIYCLVTYDH